MKLRTAIKIQQVLEGHRVKDLGRLHYWKRRTILKSRCICRRKWQDRRVPYIPSDDELDERCMVMMSVLADVFIVDETDREEFKEALWSDSLEELAAKKRFDLQ